MSDAYQRYHSPEPPVPAETIAWAFSHGRDQAGLVDGAIFAQLTWKRLPGFAILRANSARSKLVNPINFCVFVPI